MPEFYMPSEKIYDTISSLVQGFWFEIDEEGMVVLFLKFEASILTKLIKGCKFELVVRNPKLLNQGMTLYVYDNPKDPLWVTWNKFDEGDNRFLGFDKVSIELIKSQKIRVVYFNHLNVPVYTTVLNKENTFSKFESWVYDIYNLDEPLENVNDGYFAPENSRKGFLISIVNVDGSNDTKMNFFTPLQTIEWDEEPTNTERYNFNDYLKDGKHGYNQEISIKSFLPIIFDIHKELFYSPLKSDGNELIDFLICHENAVVLIESKFIISEKKTKLHNAITKAIKQLNTAQEIVEKHLDQVVNTHDLNSKLKNCNIILRICLFNDTQSLIGSKSSNLISSFNKPELPIFISVMSFFQLLGEMKVTFGEQYKFNIIQNLIFLYEDFLNSDKEILIIRDYKLHKKP